MRMVAAILGHYVASVVSAARTSRRLGVYVAAAGPGTVGCPEREWNLGVDAVCGAASGSAFRLAGESELGSER